MKITIYELLGLVKDGKAPKKIKYHNEILYFDDGTKDYYNDEDMHSLFGCTGCMLNDEVKILEEKKIPEKLNYTKECMSSSNGFLLQYCVDFAKKIDEIIDYLKSKGE